ncbi:MAG: glycosyltransferase family A protein [Opitutaceae bacterium]
MSEPDTIVLIPTTNRPRFLETALASVASQTARHRIMEVRVMENGGGRLSEEVCSRFSDRVPIRYIFRDPILPVLAHARVLIEEAYPARYVAILHDDDWWTPEHLGASLGALEGASTSACYSAFFNVVAESAPVVWHDSLMFWMAGGYPPVTRDWMLDLASVLVASLAGVPGHYSSLVAKATAFRACADTLYLDNQFDTDRMLAVGLARYGKIVFRPVPSVFVREHAGQESCKYDDGKRAQCLLRTTVWIFSMAKERRIDLIEEFRARLEACPPEHRRVVFPQFSKPWLYLLLGRHPRMPRVLLDYWIELQSRANGLQGKFFPSPGQSSPNRTEPLELNAV